MYAVCVQLNWVYCGDGKVTGKTLAGIGWVGVEDLQGWSGEGNSDCWEGVPLCNTLIPNQDKKTGIIMEQLTVEPSPVQLKMLLVK